MKLENSMVSNYIATLRLSVTCIFPINIFEIDKKMIELYWTHWSSLHIEVGEACQNYINYKMNMIYNSISMNYVTF